MKIKLEAGMLSFVVGISLVMTLLIFGLILSSTYYQQEYVLFHKQIDLCRNVHSGINQYLANQEFTEGGQLIDLFGEGNDSLNMRAENWGLFELVSVEAMSGSMHCRQTALIGYRAQGEGRATLYLADERRPLSLAGDARIRGTAYLPEAGLRSAYVNRDGYTGDKLLYGEKKGSSGQLPGLPDVKQLSTPGKAKQWTISLGKPDEDTSQPFSKDSVLLFTSKEALDLNRNLQGKIVVSSEKTIRVSPFAKLDNVLLYAPKIEIADGFKGRLQAFATDTLMIGRGVTLAYPSVGAVLAESGDALLSLGERSEIQGALLLTGIKEDYQKRILKLSKGSRVRGTVYAEGMAWHEGYIKGHLSCRKFLLRTPSTLYENFLYNGVLEAEPEDSPFLGIAIGEQAQKGVMEWLD